MNQADPCITKSFLLHTYSNEDLSYRNYYKEMSFVPCLTNGTFGQDIEAQTYQTKTKKNCRKGRDSKSSNCIFSNSPLAACYIMSTWT